MWALATQTAIRHSNPNQRRLCSSGSRSRTIQSLAEASQSTWMCSPRPMRARETATTVMIWKKDLIKVIILVIPGPSLYRDNKLLTRRASTSKLFPSQLPRINRFRCHPFTPHSPRTTSSLVTRWSSNPISLDKIPKKIQFSIWSWATSHKTTIVRRDIHLRTETSR